MSLGDAKSRKSLDITLVAILQSFTISLWIRPYVFNWNIDFIADCIITLTTGSVIIMWLSELITEYGIGNGASILIFQNIVAGIPKSIHNYSDLINGQNIKTALGLILLFILMLSFTILIQEGTKKIAIISAKQLSNASNTRSTSYIPLKINQGGVMPIVFASAAMTIPTYIAGFINKSKMGTMSFLFLSNGPLYIILYGTLIIAFSYFYTSLVLNPDDIAKNLKKNGSKRTGNQTWP